MTFCIPLYLGRQLTESSESYLALIYVSWPSAILLHISNKILWICIFHGVMITIVSVMRHCK